MREVVLRVPAQAVDDVLDRIRLLVAAGVREAPLPDGRVELRLRETDVLHLQVQPAGSGWSSAGS